MSLSQFDTARLGQAELEVGRGQAPAITVGGPLQLDPRGKYGPDVAVHFVIIQSDKDDHDPEHARRAPGFIKVPSAGLLGDDGRWDASVAQGDLVAGDARGIGVAVIEYTDRFAYESFTWCDHIKILTVEEAAAQQAQQAQSAG